MAVSSMAIRAVLSLARFDLHVAVQRLILRAGQAEVAAARMAVEPCRPLDCHFAAPPSSL